MSKIEVKNLKGSSTPVCNCNSFLCHWSNYSGKKATVCSKSGCTETKDLVGAHVIKCHGNANATRYIVPLCKGCNNFNNTDCFTLNTGSVLVPVVNRSKCKPC